jgi:ribonuclease T2
MMRFIFALALALSVTSAQQCVLPSESPRTRPTRVDYANREVPTDYYALALSWSPQYCNGNRDNPRARIQCVDNSFGFIVHGLWPQSAKARRNDEHPRHCKAPEVLPANVVKPYLCTIPDAQLMQDEWIKHGTCAWPNAKAYFDQTQKLYSALKLPDVSNLAGMNQGWTTAGAIRQAVLDANRSSGLKAEHTQVRVLSGNRFSEMMICYDKNFRYTRCLGQGTPDRQEVRVTRKR